MSQRDPDAPLVRSLTWLAAAATAGALAMGVVGVAMQSLGELRAQVLLTFVAIALGAALMGVQLRARRHLAGTWMAPLLGVGAAVIFVSQISFLALVWTDWKTWSIVWRVWWVSMVPSVFVTHLLLVYSVPRPRRGWLERLTAVCIVWAGLMILWLGLRADMLDGVAPAYLIVGALPAAGTIVGSLALLVRWLRGRAPLHVHARRAMIAGVLGSNLAAAVAGFYIGRATVRRQHELAADPNAAVAGSRADLHRQLDADVYGTQASVATLLGDTRIVRREPFITPEQIAHLRPRLQAGDIILERRNWYLSNPFLPGFWPHAALYVGGIDDLRRLGVADHPAVARHLEAYLAPAEGGHPYAIIEAVSEGVVFTTLEHSLHADYVAVLRPRVTPEQVAEAIVRAFAHVGKPYDFNFDFDDTSKLVCTQVVYLSYLGAVDLPTVRVAGRNTLPANQIARAYVTQRDRPDRQLDFVAFLDADPALGIARETDETAFCQSILRPRALVER